MAKQVPIVEYLALEPEPHLLANECTQCCARFFDRRNACASCENDQWKQVDIATTGEVKAFTIVGMASPGIPVPFVAAVVDCDGTSVRGNILDVEPDDQHVTLGMKVELTTNIVGTDSDGTEAVGFGFRPIS